MPRLAITADLHVDPYFDRRDPETGANLRELDLLDAVRWVGHMARAKRADALVIAGDFTEAKKVTKDGHGPTTGRIAGIREALLEGPARQIYVRGNHDWQWQGKSIVSVLGDGSGRVGFDAPGIEHVGDVAVCCIPFLDRAWWRAQPGNETKPESVAVRELAEAYQVIAAGLYVQATRAGAKAAVLIGHQQMPADLNDTQRSFLGDLDLVVDPRLLASIGYSAVVMGHVHRAQTVVDDPACPVLYVGAPERVDFAEEGEEKSFVMLDVEPGRAVRIERIPTPARRWVTLQVDDELQIAEDEVKDAVVRVVDLDPALDPEHVRLVLMNLGAFAVTSIKQRDLELVETAGSMSESLTAEQLLEADLADNPDRDALLELGREILAEAAA